MLKNYFKTALRNLLRYKGFSFINILSLAIGITGCMVIALFVWDELQFDKFIKDSDNIYRTYTRSPKENDNAALAVVSPMFATYMQQQYPEVETTTRIMMWSGRMLLENGETKSYEDKGFIADSTFFKMFPLKFLRGDANTALQGSTSVVLTEDIAKKYFGLADPIGKIIKLDTASFQVKGVVAKLPDHFHLDFNYVVPMPASGVPSERMQRWGWQQFFTYIKLKPGTNIKAFEAKFQEAVKKEAHNIKGEDITYIPYFQPLHDVHLKSSNFLYNHIKQGNDTYVKGLSLIAIFVLVIACFNFVNLATARSFRRAREIGVRKVIGADRKQLIVQYTGETILLSVIAIIIATIATLIILPALNNFTEKNISFNPITNPSIGLLILVAGVIIGIIAGIYPAFILSGFKPILVLKGMKSGAESSNNTSWVRQALVIVQFAMSALLIVSTMIVYRQINYLNQKDLGFNKEQILYFPVRGAVETNFETFKQELQRVQGVVSVTGGYGLPGDQVAGDGITVPGKDGDKNHSVIQILADHDYISTLGMKIIAGRDFSREMKTDVEEAFIINEAAVKELGFGTPEKAIGQRLSWDKWVPDSLNPVKRGRVIGVIKDVHYKSLHEKINATVLQIYPPVLAKVAVKIKTENMQSTIENIKATWSKISPAYPIDYNFLDDQFNKMYKAEDKLKTLLLIFTIMAIVVGCMGLFGLAAFSAEQRTKEIGIRKVLGASIISIMTLLSKTFLKPVLIASLIAFPIAWWAMQNWLEDFPYRVSISWWIFALAAASALIIALITVSFQALKAAIANPVKSLRSE